MTYKVDANIVFSCILKLDGKVPAALFILIESIIFIAPDFSKQK